MRSGPERFLCSAARGIGPTRRSSLLALFGIALARSARAGDLTRVSLATATPGGGFPAFGAAFAEAIRAVDPGLVVEPRPSGGSAENLGLLRAGSVDLALVQGEYAYPALDAADGLTVLAPMYSTPGLFVVPAASPVRTVADLRGRPVALGTRNSGLTVMGRRVLEASDLDPERDVQPILLNHAGDGPDMLRDGRADALWGGGLGWPGFLAVARAPSGARFVGPDAPAIERLVRSGGVLRPLTVPAGSFPGQGDPIATVGSWSLVLARPEFDGALAYRLVQALAGADMAARHPQGAESAPRNLARLVPPSRLNPGTARYLREAGMDLE